MAENIPVVPSRREALLAAASVARATAAAAALPAVKLGPHTLSRLIVGGNPVSGNSHTSDGMGRDMRDYFTAANIKKLLRDCEQAGINTWQSRGDRHIQRILNEYRLLPFQKEAQELMARAMEDFFFGAGGQVPADYRPQH